MNNLARDLVLGLSGAIRGAEWAMTLNLALEAVGVIGRFHKAERQWVFVGGSHADSARAEAFWNELVKCWPLGEFQREADAVAAVLKRFSLTPLLPGGDS